MIVSCHARHHGKEKLSIKVGKLLLGTALRSEKHPALFGREATAEADAGNGGAQAWRREMPRDSKSLGR